MKSGSCIQFQTVFFLLSANNSRCSFMHLQVARHSPCPWDQPRTTLTLTLQSAGATAQCSNASTAEEPGHWGSESGTAQLLGFLFPPQSFLPSQTATQQPSLHSAAGINPAANRLWEDALALPALQVFTQTPLLWPDHRLFPAAPAGQRGKGFS